MASKGGKLASAKPDKVPSSKLDKLIPKSGNLASATGTIHTKHSSPYYIPDFNHYLLL